MSMIFYDKEREKSMFFTDYLLSESIRAKECLYGVNSEFDNKDWITYDGEDNTIIVTFVKIDTNIFCVQLRSDGVIGFSLVLDGIDYSKISDFKYLMSHLSDTRHETKKILNVFSKLVYVFLQGISILKPDRIMFRAANAALGNAYLHIVQNKYLMKDIETYGYEYTGIDEDGMYILDKIKPKPLTIHQKIKHLLWRDNARISRTK